MAYSNGGWGRGDEQERLLAGEESRLQQTAARRLDVHGLSIEEAIAQEKLQEARDIEEGVTDVAECYAELNKLVAHQGQGIDVAEQNVEKAHEDVEKGHEQLQKANKHARSQRKWMMCICILLISIGAILGLVLHYATS